MDIFRRLHEEQGITLIMVTHDPNIGAEAERTINLMDGQVIE
jgi:putative ABC transport system ATP-binding protein